MAVSRCCCGEPPVTSYAGLKSCVFLDADEVAFSPIGNFILQIDGLGHAFGSPTEPQCFVYSVGFPGVGIFTTPAVIARVKILGYEWIDDPPGVIPPPRSVHVLGIRRDIPFQDAPQPSWLYFDEDRTVSEAETLGDNLDVTAIFNEWAAWPGAIHAQQERAFWIVVKPLWTSPATAQLPRVEDDIPLGATTVECEFAF